MATITPTLTLTANSATGTTTPLGPLSFALNLSTTDNIFVDNVETQVFDVDTGANVEILNGSDLETAFTPGTNGCWIYMRNATTSGTDTICVGIVNEGTAAPATDNGTDDLTRAHADSHRTFALLPGEFAFFPFDYCGDIYAQGTANNQTLEYWRFDRHTS